MKKLQVIIPLAGMLLISLAAATPRPNTKANAGNLMNSYIVVLKDGVNQNVFNQHLSWLERTNKQLGASQFAGQKHEYKIGTFNGYSGEFNALTVARIKARPEVAFVEPNGAVEISNCISQSIKPAEGEWGLGRISHRSVGPWNKYLYNNNKPRCNTPLYAYVVDSGIRTTHEEFEGRASHIFKADSTWTINDNCGHGTHVAGTIAGKTYGVVKTAKLFAVKVLESQPWGPCTGSWAGIIAGLHFAYNHAGPENRHRSVVNMSLGSTLSQSLNLAVSNCVAGNMTVVAAAGNKGYDACSDSPGSEKSAITVGATDMLDVVAEWSNIGCCLDIFGPGVDIKSAYSDATTLNNKTIIYSGTSMAASYISGTILYNKCIYGLDTPKKDRGHLLKTATNGIITGNTCWKGCCPLNSLLFNGGCAA